MPGRLSLGCERDFVPHSGKNPYEFPPLTAQIRVSNSSRFRPLWVIHFPTLQFPSASKTGSRK